MAFLNRSHSHYLLYLVTSMVTAQKSPVLLKSVLTRQGSTTLFHTFGNNTYMVEQAIGQTGIIGAIPRNRILVQQGFVTYYRPTKTREDAIKDGLVEPLVYPNPVSKTLNIAFSKKTKSAISIGVYDLSGRFLLSKVHGPDSSIELELDHLQEAIYFLQIKADGHTWGEEIIKRNQ